MKRKLKIYQDGGDAPLPPIGSKAYYDALKAKENKKSDNTTVSKKPRKLSEEELKEYDKFREKQEKNRFAKNSNYTREELTTREKRTPESDEHRRKQNQKYANSHGGYVNKNGDYVQGLGNDAADSKIANRTYDNIVEPLINAEMTMSGAGALSKGALKVAAEAEAKQLLKQASKKLTKPHWLKGYKEVPKPTFSQPEINNYKYPSFKETNDVPFTDELINSKIKKETDWLRSDEYIKRKANSTGKSIENIKKESEEIINHINNTSLNYTGKDEGNILGLYSSDKKNPKISIFNKDYNLPEGVVDHEIKHSFSELATNNNYSNYPNVNLNKTFKDKLKSFLDINEINKPVEQQVIGRRMMDKIENTQGMSRGSKLEESNINQLVDDLKYEQFDDMMQLTEGFKKKFGKEYPKQLTNFLNKAWVGIPAVAGSVASQQEYQMGGNIKTSTQGYKRNSPDRNEEELIIPSNRITMKNVPHKVLGVDNFGYSQIMEPNFDYEFPGDYVIERKLQKGGDKNKKPSERKPIITNDPRLRASQTDSLILYNNSVALQNYYNKYTKEGEVPYRDTKDAARFALEETMKQYKPQTSRSRLGNNLSVARDEKFKMSDYYQKLDDNKFAQREEATGMLDLRAPFPIYDKRIKPQKTVTYSNDIKNDRMRGDMIDLPMYDPIAVKPYNMLTSAEKIIRDKKYPQKTTQTFTKKPIQSYKQKPQDNWRVSEDEYNKKGIPLNEIDFKNVKIINGRKVYGTRLTDKPTDKEFGEPETEEQIERIEGYDITPTENKKVTPKPTQEKTDFYIQSLDKDGKQKVKYFNSKKEKDDYDEKLSKDFYFTSKTDNSTQYTAILPEMENGGTMDKLGVENSLWNNIRAKVGSGKKPSKEMLEQERKISKKQMGGNIAKKFLEPNDSKLSKGYIYPSNQPSTELATSIGGEDGEPAYLIPSFKNGRQLKNPIKEFQKTGEHLGGPFKTWQEAEEFGKMRHTYVEKGETIPYPLKRVGIDYDQAKMQMGGEPEFDVNNPLKYSYETLIQPGLNTPTSFRDMNMGNSYNPQDKPAPLPKPDFRVKPLQLQDQKKKEQQEQFGLSHIPILATNILAKTFSNSMNNREIERNNQRVNAFQSSPTYTPQGAAQYGDYTHDLSAYRPMAQLGGQYSEGFGMETVAPQINMPNQSYAHQPQEQYIEENTVSNVPAKEFIKQLEGFEKKAKWDYAQNSVGYGTKAKYKGEVIDEAEAENRLEQEVVEVDNVISKKLKVPIHPNEKTTLLSLGYNLGPHSPIVAKVIQKLNNNEDRNEIAKYIEKSGLTGVGSKKILKGLVNRRKKEANMLLGNFQEGGEYEMSEDEIEEFILQGGQLKYLD